jgi:hypothetical protein
MEAKRETSVTEVDEALTDDDINFYSMSDAHLATYIRTAETARAQLERDAIHTGNQITELKSQLHLVQNDHRMVLAMLNDIKAKLQLANNHRYVREASGDE